MNMKQIKKLNIFLVSAFALMFVFGAATSAHATYIMNPGLPEYQVYPGYQDPIIMAPSVNEGTIQATPAPIPNTETPLQASNPTYYGTNTNTSTYVYNPQPIVTLGTPTTTSTTNTNNQVLGTTVHTVAVAPIATTNTTTGIDANSTSSNVCSGDTVNYTINYANTTGGTITNAMLVILMPSGIDYTSATAQASYSAPDKTVTILIGTLSAKQNGTVYLQGKANGLANGAATIATRVDFTYTKANGVNETTTTYITHSGLNCGNVLGANVLGSGFLPTSFAGWVILTVLICAIIYIARKYFSNKKEEHMHAEHLEHQTH